jgi:hypothetical protein
MLTNPEKLNLAQSANIAHVIELLNECKTQFASIVGDSQHSTVVNAVILEAEAAIIGRFFTKIENYKQGVYENQD